MLLVDTSVWIDHFRRRNARLVEQLEAVSVLTHAFVIGELACGNLARRSEVLGALAALPRAPRVGDEEVSEFLESHRLHGRGLGWVDVHLLASAHRVRVSFWTRDRRLAAAADDLKLGPVEL